jgi:hypothetical protein
VLDANAALIKSVVSSAHKASIFEHALYEVVNKEGVNVGSQGEATEATLKESVQLLKEAKQTRESVIGEGVGAVQKASQQIADSLGSSLLIEEGHQNEYLDLADLKKLLADKLSNARDKLKQIIEDVKQKLQDGTEKVREVLKQLFEKLGLEDKWNEIKNTIDTFESYRFGMKANDEAQETKESFDVAKSEMSEFLDEVNYDLRINKRGFLDGIKYIWTKIKNALIRLGNAIKNAAISFFDKHHDTIMKALDLTGQVVVAVGKKLIMVAIAAGTEQIVATIIGAVG